MALRTEMTFHEHCFEQRTGLVWYYSSVKRTSTQRCFANPKIIEHEK